MVNRIEKRELDFYKNQLKIALDIINKNGLSSEWANRITKEQFKGQNKDD